VSYSSLYLFTSNDVYNEGIDRNAVSEDRITRKGLEAQRYIEEKTRTFFEPREMTLTMNGSGRPTLFLPHPIISLTSVTVTPNDFDTGAEVLNLSDLMIFGRVPWRDGKDDRRNPKIEFKDWRRPGLIVNCTDTWMGQSTWPQGHLNVQIVGTFGFVEEDGTSAPPDIVEAAIRLTIRNLGSIGDLAVQDDLRRQAITSETTDGHSYSLGNTGDNTGFIGDREVDRRIARYTRMPFIGTTTRRR
jgi:hypothetical protein